MINELMLQANDIRMSIIDMLFHAKSGHTAGALGMTDVMTYLYFYEMKVNPKNPHLKSRDFFLLSNGHTAPVFYATLAHRGYFPKKELFTLRKLHSKLQGHPSRDWGLDRGTKNEHGLPGVENSGGPLGQGISQAVGLAAELKRSKSKQRVFCYVGDGELQEGVCWEALLFAHKEQLDNLIIIVDKNDIQIDGTPQDVLAFDKLHEKFVAFGCRVVEFDANNMNQIAHVFKEIKKFSGKPLCLLANSVPGKGVSFMEGDYHWHGKAPDEVEKNKAIDELMTQRILLEGKNNQKETLKTKVLKKVRTKK
jgi:transketolase